MHALKVENLHVHACHKLSRSWSRHNLMAHAHSDRITRVGKADVIENILGEAAL